MKKGMTQSSTLELCPQCSKNGKSSKLIFIYYRRDEAYSTCENKKCIYFVTNTQGNPIKFKFNEKEARLIPVTQAVEHKTDDTDDSLDELLQFMNSDVQDSIRINSSIINTTKKADLPNASPIPDISCLSQFENEKSLFSESTDDYFDVDSFLRGLN